ncbi:MAG: cob(I)yrinic acid a,c-diamide adenosyltransferase [Rhodothermales bacterium]
MKIYTRTGDQGTTALFGGGRVVKSHPRIEAYGTVDETNSILGLVRSHLANAPTCADADVVLTRIQNELFVAGADLATPLNAKPFVPRIGTDLVTALESDIDRFDGDLPPLKAFILPGGHVAASVLHLARTTCRRAERLTVELAALEPINEDTIVYLNRLSDLLFTLSRWVNYATGVSDVEWQAA